MGEEERSVRHNACFHALDLRVVRGEADHPALVHELADGTTRTTTCAELLAEVAALGGVLRAFGVGPDDRVGLSLPEGPQAVISMLACARIGAEPVMTEDPQVSVALRHSAEAGAVVAADGQELAWDVAMRAGRTDPAAVVEVSRTGAGSLSSAGSLLFEPLLRGAPVVLREAGKSHR